MKLRIKIMKSAEQTASAERVSSIDDLLLEILLRLPIRSLIRFKCVSKRWLSLITNPRFSLLRNPNPNPAVGLFLPRQAFGINPEYDYIHLDTHSHTNPPFKKLRFTEEPSGIYILQSCNGLLLCRSFFASQSKHKYCVYNPTTKHFSTLPKTGLGTKTSKTREMSLAFNPGLSPHYKVVYVSKIIRGMSLAFDPAKSPHYKVVCIRDSESSLDHFEVEVYSSDTGHWRAVGDPFLSNVCFRNGVYWNGAIHWISTWENLTILSFNVYQETRGTMHVPPLREGGHVGYFGESCGHLHLVAIYEAEGIFDVHEMKSDCSQWFVKYRVDVKQVFVAFPEMITDWDSYAFSIFSLVRGKREEGDSFLVLQIPGKAIRYNLVDGSFDKLCDFEDAEEHGSLRYLEHAFEYVESLCCV